MRTEFETIDEYFDANEIKTNKHLSVCTFLIVIANPIIYILKVLKVFPASNLFRILITTIVALLFDLIIFFVIKKNPENKNNKYFLMILTQPLLLSLSVETGIHFSILYAFIPLMSCIYYNKKFTIHCIIFSYINMIVSFGLKAVLLEEGSVRLSKIKWFAAYASGSTLEFLAYSVFCFYLTQEIKKVVERNFENKKSIQQMQSKLIFGFANIAESRETGNQNHIKRLCAYVKLIGNKLLQRNCFPEILTPHYIELMIQAVPFHDIGKLSIPIEILNKEGKLTPEEYTIVKYHPVDSAEFISKKMTEIDDTDLLQVAKDIALYHHERIDGTGYPYKLSGDAIPLCARIVAVADIIDALLSKRAYKEPYSIEKAFDIIRGLSNSALDETVVDALLSCADEVNNIKKGDSSKYD